MPEGDNLRALLSVENAQTAISIIERMTWKPYHEGGGLFVDGTPLPEYVAKAAASGALAAAAGRHTAKPDAEKLQEITEVLGFTYTPSTAQGVRLNDILWLTGKRRGLLFIWRIEGDNEPAQFIAWNARTNRWVKPFRAGPPVDGNYYNTYHFGEIITTPDRAKKVAAEIGIDAANNYQVRQLPEITDEFVAKEMPTPEGEQPDGKRLRVRAEEERERALWDETNNLLSMHGRAQVAARDYFFNIFRQQALRSCRSSYDAKKLISVMRKNLEKQLNTRVRRRRQALGIP